MLGIEFNGVQHYEYVPFFHKNEIVFQERQADDLMKVQKCKEYGVNLIIVPYTIEHNDICSFIAREAILLEYTLTNSPSTMDLSLLKSNNTIKDNIMRTINSKKGTLIDGTFLNGNCILKIKCANGNIFVTKIIYLRRDTWCPCSACAHVFSDESKIKISNSLKQFYSTDAGKIIKANSHQKRSATMQERKDIIRSTIVEKKCTKCNMVKSVDLFSKRSAGTSGYQSWCRLCVAENKARIRESKK